MKTLRSSLNAIILAAWSASLVKGQFPLNGDNGALAKMKNFLIFEEKTVQRLAKKEAELNDRAVHFMKAKEKFDLIQTQIDRGSLVIPGVIDEPIEKNKNAGEQVIDPRTPTGFGNPFFRQIKLEQNVEMDALITEAELKAIRKANEPMEPPMASGWSVVASYGSLKSSFERKPEFVHNLYSSPNGIVRRICSSCENSIYKEVYYKRKTSTISKWLLFAMIGDTRENSKRNADFTDWCIADVIQSDTCGTENRCFIDYDLFSTYEDAKANRYPWAYCQHAGTGGRGFPGISGTNANTYDSSQLNFYGSLQKDYMIQVEDTSWIPLSGTGVFYLWGRRANKDVKDIYMDNWKQTLFDSKNSIIRRSCLDCPDGWKDLYMKRITDAPDDFMETLHYNFVEKNKNLLNRDFQIFSSYENALNSIDPWQYCEQGQEPMGFPGSCKPTADAVVPNIWSRNKQNKLTDYEAGMKDIAFFIEKEGEPETEEWMREEDEMKHFLYPDSTLDRYDNIVCKPSQNFFSTGTTDNFFPTDYKPYIFQGRDDDYAGWYDLSGCGKCRDWCGWFSRVGSPFDGGHNPHYKSFTSGGDAFACLTAQAGQGVMRYSGLDNTEVTSGFVPQEFKSPMNYYTGFLRFIPSNVLKCPDQSSSQVILADESKYDYLGCFNDSPGAFSQNYDQRDVHECYMLCRNLGYFYFGRHGNGICRCSGLSESDTAYAANGESTSNQYARRDRKRKLWHNTLQNKYEANNFFDESCGDCESNDIGEGVNCMWHAKDTTSRPTSAPTTNSPTSMPTFDPNPHRCNINNPCTRGEAAGKCCSTYGWCGTSEAHCSKRRGCVSNCWSYDPTQAPTLSQLPSSAPSNSPTLSALGACSQILRLRPSANDKEYEILHHATGNLFTIYCDGMKSGFPSEYLSLLSEDNYSRYSAWNEDTTTYFSKVSLDTNLLFIDTTNFSFSSSQGSALGPNSVPVLQQPFGTAGSCKGSYIDDGFAKMDLTGTQFEIIDSFTIGGWQADGTDQIYDGNQIIELTGGGFCGWNKPINDQIQLNFVKTNQVFYPNHDTYVRKGTKAYDNFGNNDYLDVKNYDGLGAIYHRTSFLMFDTSTIQVDDYAAILRLYLARTVSGNDNAWNNSVQISRISQTNWDETQVTFNNFQPQIEKVGPTVRIDATMDKSWIEIDISDLFVKGDFTIEVSFKNHNTNLGKFYSKDSASIFSPSIEIVPRSLELLVPESSQYSLVYSLDITDTVNYYQSPPPYSVDNHLQQEFMMGIERIGYFMELNSALYGYQWLWVTMNAFTNDTAKIGIPTQASGAVFQQELQNVTVYSSESFLEGNVMEGYIEFWSSNYGKGNAQGVVGASSNVYDFGDTIDENGKYGSMQIHIPAKASTLFSLNSFNRGSKPDLGIGNNPKGNPDWTFAANADIYTEKSLKVFVIPSNNEYYNGYYNYYNYYYNYYNYCGYYNYYGTSSTGISSFSGRKLFHCSDARRKLTHENTCQSFSTERFQGDFGENIVPYQYHFPPKDDQYAGWYDIQRCGKCNDWCAWIGSEADGSGVNPRYKSRTATDYFSCKLAGGYSSAYGMTTENFFAEGFNYTKCEGQGADTPAYRKDKYLGCFNDSSNRALPVKIGNNIPLQDCIESCRTMGYHYAGLQYDRECWCGATRQSDLSYAKHGEIDMNDSNYCACESNWIGPWKNCVFQILDQFDPEVERNKHPCSHIPTMDLRRYCYVSCRDSDESFRHLITCKKMTVMGLQSLNREISSFLDSPICDSKDCTKESHPLGEDVKESGGTF